jgi:peptidyl-prolyl cis-trans isomerase A (cyclophilin A)
MIWKVSARRRAAFLARLRGLVKPCRKASLARVPALSFSRAVLVLALTAGCVFTPPPPLPGEAGYGAEASGLGSPALSRPEAAGGEPAKPVATFRKGQEPRPGMSLAEIEAFNAAQGDPISGFFTLDEALEGVTGQGKLWAEFVTDRGVIPCELHEQLTPVTVANFVGLARGVRPWYDRDLDEWITKPYYDDTTFHRVIPDFMIQGGDPTGTGRGNPHYVIPDEFHPDLRHDDAGVLSMANKGANTGSAQFFITLAPTDHLDDVHTVFGRCTPEGIEVARKIADVARDAADRPLAVEVLREVRIVRR